MKSEAQSSSISLRDLYFQAAEKQSAEERAAFLDRVCEDRPALRQQLEALLREKRDDSFLEHPAVEPGATLVPPAPLSEGPGTVIGRYKLLQKIGEGGMGVVYMAEQTEPVTRKVALKIIKLGMDTRQVVARFEAERQALAMMDHPNIAKVLDAGATETGRPYFVMELVRGVPITEYCDHARLSTCERLGLFVKVCQAIQHAHQKGVIHRDIKPSNVMVTLNDGAPHPMVIDFGIAKATHQKLTEKTLFTNYTQMIGTPAYMSPEQAEMSKLDVDTRTDVYSLGVLLYELLTGTTPFSSHELRDLGYREMQKVIVEKDPPRPSTRLHESTTLTALAASRNTEPRKLPGIVRGDLDWIVMKAISKERSDRYQTAETLAADVERHLQDRPIAARRPSVVGRVRRFVRRNKMPVGLTVVAALAGLVAALLGVVAYLGKLDQREQALLLEQKHTQEARETWARQTAMPAIKQLIEDEHWVRAFLLAREVRQVLPSDPAFQELWDSFTVTVSFDLKPEGTRVLIRDWDATDEAWFEVGETPLVDITLPNGGMRFRYVKEGYLAREFDRTFPDFLRWDGAISMKPDPGLPRDMVFIDSVQASGWNDLPTDLGDFLIDRYEVSNGEFQKFVDAGGYEDPKFWGHLDFHLEGRRLSWEEAMQQFRDVTGAAGPAAWRDGHFPESRQDYPVRGVSWFEAAAYARFVGKSLPTIYHWRWAADGAAGHTIALSNFSGHGPAPRGAHQGIGRFDVYDLGGNVEEWCWNSDGAARRCLRGGAWNDAGYQLLQVGVASPWNRAETYGFRCVRYLGEGAPAAVAAAPWKPKLPHLDASRRVPIESLASWYVYETNLALAPQPVEAKDEPSPDYRHEIVSIAAAYNEERFDVHLYFPREPKKRYETILFVPGAVSWLTRRFAPTGIDWELLPRLTQEGRLVCFPVCKGMYERGSGQFSIPQGTVQSRDAVVWAVKDVARTLDYLRTREDIDPDRIFYLGYSLGTMIGMPVLTFKPGLRGAILVSGGYPPKELNEVQQVYNPFHFTPRVTLPVLMITGGLDSLLPHQSVQLPFFEDLGSKNKKFVELDCGHNPPTDDVMRAVDPWLRDLSGPP